MVIDTFRRQLVKARAEVKGEAVSVARKIKNASDIPEVAEKMTPGGGSPPQSTGIGIRMLDGKPMVWATDGSLRHALGRKTTKAARKALKRARRAAQKSS